MKETLIAFKMDITYEKKALRAKAIAGSLKHTVIQHLKLGVSSNVPLWRNWLFIHECQCLSSLSS